MKVYIGPYTNWVGPYQIVDFFLKPFIKDEDKLHDIGSWLSETFVGDVCQFIHSKKKQKIKVKIHGYDTWSMDHQLSHIIHPMLIQLKNSQHGGGQVDDADVPENIRSTSAKPKEDEWDTDEFFFDRWDWVLNEMIWAFGEIKEDTWESQYHTGKSDYVYNPVDENGNKVSKKDAVLFELTKGPSDTRVFDSEGYKKHADRITNGTRLFGLYYQSLWD